MLNSYSQWPSNITSDYGWFHVYAFTMLFGMVLSIIASWYKMHRYQVSSDGLTWSIFFIIPASLFGASWFGKNNPLNPIGFWKQFAFWNPGMSIHGGVLFGTIVGLIFFACVKSKTKISLFVYADCIVPNILLGQVVGRWGNFFNHELLGHIVGHSTSLDGSAISAINWLPAFIRDNCFQLLINGSPETAIINGESKYVFRAPIFLYESLANLGLWTFLTFLLPKTFRWFSKKPWKVESEKFKLLSFGDLITLKSDVQETKETKNISNKQKTFNDQVLLLFSQGENNKTNQTGWQSFNQKFNFIIKNPVKFLGLSSTLVFRNWKLKRKYWNEAFYQYKVNSFTIKALDQKYDEEKKKILNNEKKYFRKNYLISKAYWHRSKKLYYLNNPNNYLVMRSGVQTWLYFFGWNLIRFCLELQRADNNLFILNRRALDYAVLISIFVIALILAVVSQLVFAKYNRKSGWTYEKQY